MDDASDICTRPVTEKYSKSFSDLQGGALTRLVLPREGLNVSTTRGKNTVLEISQWTDLQFKEFINQNKHVVVGLYLTKKLHRMDHGFKQTAKLSKFTTTRFILVNCDANIFNSQSSAMETRSGLDSALITDADDRCMFEYEDPHNVDADAEDVDEDETLEEDAQIPNREEYAEDAETADAQINPDDSNARQKFDMFSPLP
ncbi:hypothetical protein DFS33DRAFT_1379401 [Desarmillaria ectypa]|nr:hypothetical protein DFS33DRAFT_1379401 [Desarmillaria ectypa]